AGCEQLVGPQLDRQVEQVGVGLGGEIRADPGGRLLAPQDVGRLEQHEVRREQVGPAQLIGGPLAGGPTVDEQRDDRRGIADDGAGHGGQRRSASRSATISSGSTRDPVAATRARARAMTSSTDGLVAAVMSNPRTYSCRDFPARAARAASSSRISSGTSRIVMATTRCRVAAMPAICCLILPLSVAVEPVLARG